MVAVPPPRLPKLKPPVGAFWRPVAAGVAAISALGVAEPPKLLKLNPSAGAIGGSDVAAGVAGLGAPPPRLLKLKPPVFGASVVGAGFSALALPRLPKLKPPEGAAGAFSVFDPSAVGSAGLAPNWFPPKRFPVVGALAPAGATDLLESDVAGAGGAAAKRDGVDLDESLEAAVCSAGFALKLKRPPDDGGGAAGVVVPAALPKMPAPGAGDPGVVPVLAVVVAGFAPNKPPPLAAGAFSAGFALNKEPPDAGGAAPRVEEPLPLPPNKLVPVPAGLAPNRLPPALPGGGAAGVVDCPKPPNRGLDAGVVEPEAGAVAGALPPKLKVCVGAGAAAGVPDWALFCWPNEKGDDAAGVEVLFDVVLLVLPKSEAPAGFGLVVPPPPKSPPPI